MLRVDPVHDGKVRGGGELGGWMRGERAPGGTLHVEKLHAERVRPRMLQVEMVHDRKLHAGVVQAGIVCAGKVGGELLGTEVVDRGIPLVAAWLVLTVVACRSSYWHRIVQVLPVMAQQVDLASLLDQDASRVDS